MTTIFTVILMTSGVVQAKEENEEAKILEEPTETENTNATPTNTTHFSDQLTAARPGEEPISHEAQIIPTSSLIKQQHSSVQITASRGVAEKTLTPDSEEEKFGLLTSVSFFTAISKISATATVVSTVLQGTDKQTNQELETNPTVEKTATAFTMARNPSFTSSPETNIVIQETVKQTDLVSTPVMAKAAATTAVNTSSAVASTTNVFVQETLKQTDQVSIAGMTKAAVSSTTAINSSSTLESVKQTKPLTTPLLAKSVTVTPRKHLVLTKAAVFATTAVNTSSTVASNATVQVPVTQTDQVSTEEMTVAATSSTTAIITSSTVKSVNQAKPLATPLLIKTVTPTSLPVTPKVTKHLNTLELYSVATSLIPRQFTASITMKTPPDVEYSSKASKSEELWWLYVCVPVIMLAVLLVTSGVYAVRKRYARKSKELPEERHRLNEEETQL